MYALVDEISTATINHVSDDPIINHESADVSRYHSA